MLWWLIDHANLLYFLLGTAALGLLVLWWTLRQSKLLLGFGVVAALIALVWLLSVLIVTDRKQLTRNVEVMARAVSQGNLDEMLKYVADDFHINNRRLSKQELKMAAEAALRRYRVGEITVWRIEVEKLTRPHATVTLYASPVEPYTPIFCSIEFVMVREGEWQMQTIQVFRAVGDNKHPEQLPF